MFITKTRKCENNLLMLVSKIVPNREHVYPLTLFPNFKIQILKTLFLDYLINCDHNQLHSTYIKYNIQD